MPMFLLFLCLSERESFNACSAAADKAGHFVCGSHSESKAQEPLPKHSPTIGLRYPLHWPNNSISFCPKQLYIIRKRENLQKKDLEGFIYSLLCKKIRKRGSLTTLLFVQPLNILSEYMNKYNPTLFKLFINFCVIFTKNLCCEINTHSWSEH